ncbi:hypothetical protein [Catenulispora rubra]|uniref:hypothetical protein n=1 Tax=Catenulispora rubra TaxID=280293 RepID=UPI0018922757|nr:hypothetical protein [Catenulispora rubra]
MEAEERRRQRGQEAELIAELRRVRTQAAAAAALGGSRVAVPDAAPARDGSTSADLAQHNQRLAEALATSRAAVEDEHRRVGEKRLRKALSRASTRREGAGRLSAPVAAPTEAEELAVVAAEREAALIEAEALVDDYRARCLPDALGFVEVCQHQMAEAETRQQVQAALHSMKIQMNKAAIAGDAAREADIRRARLLALIADAPEAEQEQLRDLVTGAADLKVAGPAVTEAVGRADAARRTAAVAAVAVNALRDLGCRVSEGAVLDLAGAKSVVAPFADGPYGLLVRFQDRDRLVTAVVRRDDVAADRERDTAVQQEFCDSGLPRFTESFVAAGVAMRPFHRNDPGHPPPGTGAAHAWDRGEGTVRRKDEGRARQ